MFLGSPLLRIDPNINDSLYLGYICNDQPTIWTMFYKILAKINKAILPSYTKRGLDLAKASKLQLAIIGWRYYVTTRALDS